MCRRDAAVWLLAAYLAAGALAAVASGIWNAWALDIDIDMQARVAEYAGFREGVYPNGHVDTWPDGAKPAYSVYPPYALPMFVPFFEPGGKVQGRVVVESLSLIGLFLIGILGRRTLHPHGVAWGAVGALAAAGITLNRSVFSLGQFSAICAGGIALQIGFLERNRPLLAGASWAAAMLKPQIGLPFAALFLFNGHWRGLACGITILAVLSLAALWWTDVSPAALADHWLFRMGMNFAAESDGFGPADVAEWMGWDHRVVQYMALAALVGVVAALAVVMRRDIRVRSLLPVAAICAVLGRVLFYHRSCDQVMLFPLLLTCLSQALTAPRWHTIAVATVVAAALWIPYRLQEFLPGYEVVQASTWIAAGAVVCVVAMRLRDWPRGESA